MTPPHPPVNGQFAHTPVKKLYYKGNWGGESNLKVVYRTNNTQKNTDHFTRTG